MRTMMVPQGKPFLSTIFCKNDNIILQKKNWLSAQLNLIIEIFNESFTIYTWIWLGGERREKQ